MSRDSLFGETVLWSGRPKEVTTPTVYRVAALVCAVSAAVATASAVVVATALTARPSGLLAFAAWMTTLAIALDFGPRWWRSRLEFIVTERHIVMRRGQVRRSIDIRGISYARIHWHPRLPGIGDLELVRAVPTGALRRRLSIVLHGLIAPDRVWAIMRGVTPTAPGGDGHRLLAQRLDEGERVLWSAQPQASWRAWVPTGARSVGSIAIALGLGGVGVWMACEAVRNLRLVVTVGGMPRGSASFVALVVSWSLVVVLLLSASVASLYTVVVKPARLAAETRYLITDRRVLIQRGDEELHLDRSRIVDVIAVEAAGGALASAGKAGVIDAPGVGGLADIFLVLDGPRARAVAANGAFGEAGGQGLQPVLQRITDAEAVQRILEEAPAARALHAA